MKHLIKNSYSILYIIILLFSSCKKEEEDTASTTAQLVASDFSTIHHGVFEEWDTLGKITTNISDTEELRFELLNQAPENVLEILSDGSLRIAEETAIDFEKDSILSGEVVVHHQEESDTVFYHIQISNLKVFVSHWELNGTKTLYLPIHEGVPYAETAYNFTVDWGDGTSTKVTSFDDPDAIHHYATEGRKTVSIIGLLKGFNFYENDQSKNVIVDISSWGDISLGNAGVYFFECKNLVRFSAEDTPDLSETSTMNYMFFGAERFEGGISQWDVSNVTNMRYMFSWAEAFNDDLSSWDVSNVKDMRSMFYFAKTFNDDLSSWDVSNVRNMHYMFSGANVFTSDLSAWNVSNVIDMGYMFSGAYVFTSDLSAWDVSNVIDMSYMFNSAHAFNQDLSAWNTVNVTDCYNFSFNSALDSEYLPILGSCFGNE